VRPTLDRPRGYSGAPLLAAGLLLAAGCSRTPLLAVGLAAEAGRGAQDAPAGAAAPRAGAAAPVAGNAAPTPPEPPAELGCRDAQAAVGKADLLFVVDNSGSMREEQTSLREQFPKLVRVLMTGDTDGDGVQDFPPARDLHLGVVSTDLGLVGISDIDKCRGLGDDGVLLHDPSAQVAGCQTGYPPFLSYTGGRDDPERSAVDLACIATLGTDGCGFEQQLEAGLKALWPSSDSRITFLGDVNGFGTQGHGDGANNGFLRNDPASGLSLIVVILVTDEEDCSSQDTSHFTPAQYLDPADPRVMQDLNLRCFYNKHNLHPVERYVNGLLALRPGNEAFVLFAALAGVPPDLVGPQARARVDFADAIQRDAFYAAILDDPRMVERPDPTRAPELGGNLTPSCRSANGVAYPPRRIVEVARGFGENGFVQSICEPDFGAAIDAILLRIGERLRVPCVDSP
jgi:hypothetical protein